jgi:hypothetical protein
VSGTLLSRPLAHSSCGNPLLLAAAVFAGNGGASLIDLLVVVAVTSVLGRRDPQAGLAAVERLVLARQVNGLTSVLTVAAALGEGARASGKLGRDGGVLLDPVGEGIFAVLDDTIWLSEECMSRVRDGDLRLGGLVAVVGLASLTRGDRGVIDELEKVLSIAGNDCKLLAVLAHSVELVGESSLELLTSDVGKLGLSDKGLGLSTNELLLKNNNLGRVRLLVLQLSNLVGDLLLACIL